MRCLTYLVAEKDFVVCVEKSMPIFSYIGAGGTDVALCFVLMYQKCGKNKEERILILLN